MKMPEDTDQTIAVRPRPKAAISLEMPQDVLASLETVAARRDMSVHALIQLYIGQGLRQDLSRLFSDRVLETTAEVLSRHVPAEEVSAILQEIRGEVAV